MEKIKYKIGKSQKDHSISVDELLHRFAASNEAENHIKFYYPFRTCFARFLSDDMKGINSLSERHYIMLEKRFNEKHNFKMKIFLN